MQNKNREWQAFKQGGFNTVYKSNDGLIFKTTHYDEWNTDTPERSVRLWNLINPELTPKAYIGKIFVDGVTHRGWIGPYIAGLDLKKFLQDPVITQQYDSLIADELLAIYARTGRIIVDAAIPGNFIVTDSNQAICVDIGLAFQIDVQEEAYCSDITSRKSFVSNDAWQKLQHELIPNVLYNEQSFYPQTVQMTKALLFLKAQRPDIQTVDFLAKDKQKVALLAQAFDGDKPSGMTLLEKEQPFSLASIKKSCEQNLRNYINTRGSLDDSKKFNPSLTTKLFRSQVLTNKKVSAAEALITAIHAADSINALNDCIQKTAQNTDLQQGTWTKGYQAALGKCLLFANLNTLKPDSQLQP